MNEDDFRAALRILHDLIEGVRGFGATPKMGRFRFGFAEELLAARRLVNRAKQVYGETIYSRKRAVEWGTVERSARGKS